MMHGKMLYWQVKEAISIHGNSHSGDFYGWVQFRNCIWWIALWPREDIRYEYFGDCHRVLSDDATVYGQFEPNEQGVNELYHKMVYLRNVELLYVQLNINVL